MAEAGEVVRLAPGEEWRFCTRAECSVEVLDSGTAAAACGGVPLLSGGQRTVFPAGFCGGIGATPWGGSAPSTVHLSITPADAVASASTFVNRCDGPTRALLAALRGSPAGRVVAVVGLRSGGRSRLGRTLAAEELSRGGMVAWVDLDTDTGVFPDCVSATVAGAHHLRPEDPHLHGGARVVRYVGRHPAALRHAAGELAAGAAAVGAARTVVILPPVGVDGAVSVEALLAQVGATAVAVVGHSPLAAALCAAGPWRVFDLPRSSMAVPSASVRAGREEAARRFFEGVRGMCACRVAVPVRRIRLVQLGRPETDAELLPINGTSSWGPLDTLELPLSDGRPGAMLGVLLGSEATCPLLTCACLYVACLCVCVCVCVCVATKRFLSFLTLFWYVSRLSQDDAVWMLRTPTPALRDAVAGCDDRVSMVLMPH